MILVVKSKRKCSLLQLEMYFVYLKILELLSDVHKKYTSLGLTALQDSLIDQNRMICQVLVKNVHKISQQQQADIGNEIKRMNAIANLATIISHPSYLASQNVSQIAENASAAKKVILKWGIYEHDKATEALNEIQKAIKVSGIATKAERELIIKAIGAKAGQWFKCPNGHFYYIGECGGAMEVSKCLECKAEVGGTNHSLLSSNMHAKEFDNSRFPAYSEEANNLANFDLDNIV